MVCSHSRPLPYARVHLQAGLQARVRNVVSTECSHKGKLKRILLSFKQRVCVDGVQSCSLSTSGAVTSVARALDAPSQRRSRYLAVEATLQPQHAEVTRNSVDKKEVEKFAALSAEWWNPRGPFAALHRLNVARVKFIRDAVGDHFRARGSAHTLTQGVGQEASTSTSHVAASSGRAAHALPEAHGPIASQDRLPLQGLRVVDVGCGGGILAESLARLGADVTGVDATQENIEVARAHAALDPGIQRRISYVSELAETLVERGERFDVVVSSEVIEHVRDPEGFCKTLAALTSDSGCVAITTLNRTPMSYAMAIVGAERLLRLLPVGTHDWRKFVTPEELHIMFKAAGFGLHTLAGMNMDLQGKWKLSSSTDVNYAALLMRI